MIRAESGGNANAVSRKGARGLMQLMPGTAGQLGVKNSFDAAENVDGGVRYLMQLLQQFNYDVAKALAAYNAGPQRVAQYKGVPPYRETRAYVARIIQRLQPQEAGRDATSQACNHKDQPRCGQRLTGLFPFHWCHPEEAFTPTRDLQLARAGELSHRTTSLAR